MNNSHRGFIVPLLLVIIALLIAGGGAYVYTQTPHATQSPVTETTTTKQPAVVAPTTQSTLTAQTSDSQTAEWKTYTNTIQGFSFKYPSSWFIRETLDKTIVDFAKSELAPNDPNGLKKVFARLTVSDLVLGKEGSGYKATPQDYFNEFYANTSTRASSKWMMINGKPVFYEHPVATDSRITISDYDYLLFTKGKLVGFQVLPGVLLNYITGPWQPTDYKPGDESLIEQVIGTLSFSDKSVKFVKAGAEPSLITYKQLIHGNYASQSFQEIQFAFSVPANATKAQIQVSCDAGLFVYFSDNQTPRSPAPENICNTWQTNTPLSNPWIRDIRIENRTSKDQSMSLQTSATVDGAVLKSNLVKFSVSSDSVVVPN